MPALSGEFTFRAETAGSLQDLEVKLFDAFPDLRQLDVRICRSERAEAASCPSGARRIIW